MTLITVTDGPTFRLGNDRLSYGMRVSEEGLLEHLHFGLPLHDPPQPHPRPVRHCTVMLEDHDRLTLNELPQEYPTHGRGDFSAPALHLTDHDNSVLDLRYSSYRIMKGKPVPDRLPASRGEQAETLIVTLRDAVKYVEVDLQYTVWPDQAVLARRTAIRNSGENDLHLKHVHSTALDLPPDEYRVQHLHGTWAREFNAEILPLPTGRLTVDSSRGTSTNAHVPYLAVLGTEACETQGWCIGTTLVYSGNHQLSIERGEFGRVRLLAGINPFDFDWTLAAGESFETPEALHAISDTGLEGLSQAWHSFIRAHIIPERFREVPRPTYLNTWEAAYFNVSEDTVLDMADLAKEIGVDMVVLDDGWFKGRTDDRRALGDWTADPDRFPSGIPALAEQVQAKGLKFGLWVEPEMVSPDSDLFRAHPEWAITVPEYEPSLGRNQLTLDISRPDVADHVFDALDAILSCGKIDYVKWDMNRNMTDMGSGARAHRYMLGLYDLLERIMTAYPDILFETCASGGNRFDLGMMSYMAQGWLSDMCDPIGRLAIINGASYLFPTDVMAAYAGPSPNHQNGRVTSLSDRFAAGAVCAAQGVSLSADDIFAQIKPIRAHIARAKRISTLMLGARFDRLRYTTNETIWQQASRDRSTIQIVAFQRLNAPNLPLRCVKLRGLDPDGVYETEDGHRHGGDALMRVGLPLRSPTEDFAAELLIIRKVS